ncbi:MAG: hypothetical protein Q8R28_17085 [Dehalococcoidia bacterium]|nr:hypothetical protein [Dehalococcoidia bacterium]
MSDRVSRELYAEYRGQVLSMSTARQRMQGHSMVGVFSDREIARSLALTEEQVREIRCLAEMDGLELSWYPEAEEFKRKRAGRGKG